MELNKIYCWDCVEVMKEIEEWSIDMTITSPPYDNLRSYEWYSFDFEWTAKELYRVTKEWWVVVWIVNDATINWSESWTSFRQALYFKEVWFNLHDTMIWQKNNFSNPASTRYHQIFEYMFIFSKWKPVFNPIMDRKNIRVWWWALWEQTSRQKNWELRVRNKKAAIKEYWMRYNIWKWNTSWQENMCKHIEHPATFPLWLVKDHIRSWSNEWDIVLDPFIWSWTTAVACKELNRNFIWIEISPKYCDIANNRLSDLLT
jgi:site-specific DNA-methyltransferase (adenine-specific)